MNYKEKDVLSVIIKDIESLFIDLERDDNDYYLKMIKGNVKDLLEGFYEEGSYCKEDLETDINWLIEGNISTSEAEKFILFLLKIVASKELEQE